MLADGVASCVDCRAQDVDRDYQAHARKLDAEHFSHIQDVAARPVLTRLRSYGCVIGLSVGAFSETSATIRALLSMVVAAAADCHWQEVGATSARAARSVFMCVTRRRWGCQFAMLNARLRCDHARLACSRAAADAPDPDDLDFDFGSAAD